MTRSLSVGSPAPREPIAANYGLMFWLIWKKLSGSYFPLISTSRS